MNLPSLEKYVNTVVPGGQIYVDSTLISAKVERTDVEVYYIPATKMANDAGVPTPVSYTHLDVYKRQRHDLLQPGPFL